MINGCFEWWRWYTGPSLLDCRGYGSRPSPGQFVETLTRLIREMKKDEARVVRHLASCIDAKKSRARKLLCRTSHTSLWQCAGQEKVRVCVFIPRVRDLRSRHRRFARQCFAPKGRCHNQTDGLRGRCLTQQRRSRCIPPWWPCVKTLNAHLSRSQCVCVRYLMLARVERKVPMGPSLLNI